MFLFRNIRKVLPLAVHMLCCFGVVCSLKTSVSTVKCEFDLCDRGKQFCNDDTAICITCEYMHDYCEKNTVNANDEKCLLYYCQENKIKILNERLINYKDNVQNLTMENNSLKDELNVTNRKNFEKSNLIKNLEKQVDKLNYLNKKETETINWLIGAVAVLSIICIPIFIYHCIEWMRRPTSQCILENTSTVSSCTAPECGPLLAENHGGYKELKDESLLGNEYTLQNELKELKLNGQKENTKLVCAESEASPSNYGHIQHDANTTPKSLLVQSKSAKGNSQQQPLPHQPLTPNAPYEYPGSFNNDRYQNQQWSPTQETPTETQETPSSPPLQQTPASPPPQETLASPPPQESPLHVITHINVNVGGFQNTGSNTLLENNKITTKFQLNDTDVISNRPENDDVTENIDNQSDVNNSCRTGIGQDCNTDQRHVNNYLNTIPPSQQDQAQLYPN